MGNMEKVLVCQVYNAFFTAEPTDDIQRLNHAGRSDKVKWGRSDLKFGKFQFLDFLDCRNISEAADGA